MITRPLDLASRLKPIPRGWDALFYVNVGALAVFFFVFGSRFVLAPGLAVDFSLPQAGAGATTAWTTDVVIAVPAPDMAVVEGAVLDFASLGLWLKRQASSGVAVTSDVGPGGGVAVSANQKKRLLVQASGGLPARDLATIYALAAEAGFGGVLVATSAPDASSSSTR